MDKSASAESATHDNAAASQPNVEVEMIHPAEVQAAYRTILAKVNDAAKACGRQAVPRLVAVSKTKPAAAVHALYDIGHRHFGENYVQELVGKAPQCADDVRWHFIGQLQSNKAKQLVTGVPSLWAVESVDSAKLAGLLDKAVASMPGRPPLHVSVQVNTSGEAQKGGVEPGQAAELALYITKECPHLKLLGLMTIGKLDETASIFFERLVSEREEVARALGVQDASSLELSMGMSGDYDLAIQHGSTSVRVGSSIFGARTPKPQAAPAPAAAPAV